MSECIFGGMFRIGEFSRLSRVSVRMLRHYDQLGLLKPSQTDRLTNYRYYSAEQLPRLNRILALQDLGFSLEQIRSMLEADLPVDEVRGMLRLKGAEVEQAIQAGQERLHLPGEELARTLPADSPALHWLQRIRDEAHRFAIAGHRRRRARRFRESVLENIAGLGPARRRALLTHFGGLPGVLRAGIADLERVEGVGTALARTLYDHLHPGA